MKREGKRKSSSSCCRYYRHSQISDSITYITTTTWVTTWKGFREQQEEPTLAITLSPNALILHNVTFPSNMKRAAVQTFFLTAAKVLKQRFTRKGLGLWAKSQTSYSLDFVLISSYLFKQDNKDKGRVAAGRAEERCRLNHVLHQHHQPWRNY